MAICKLLLPLQTTATAEAALSTGLIAAEIWRAHLMVLHVASDRSRESAVHAVFNRCAAARSIAVTAPVPGARVPSASFTATIGRVADTVAYQARLADLTVVPHPASGEDVSSSDALHAVLFDSGQPVLIAPHAAPTAIGIRVCLGWNGSAESAAAAYSALPWLHRASGVRILWADEYQRRGPLAPDLADYLAAHGIAADTSMFRPINNTVGAGLLAAAEAFQCDLLALGAYSHSRLRQLILGGVTRHVLEHAKVPVLMHR
jgi:nucleotide-binding universal stress UspA family protein